MIAHSKLSQFERYRVLKEQLRLLMATTKSSIVPVILLVALSLYILSNQFNQFGLQLWAVAAIANKLLCAWHARVSLKSLDSHPFPVQVMWRLFALYVVDGLIWGCLVWCSLTGASAGEVVFAITTVAAVMAGAMATLAAVLPICIGYCVAMFLLLAAKLIQMSDPALHALNIAGLLYVVTLLGQARTVNAGILESILLRFERFALVEQLQVETQHATEANLAKTRFLAAVGHDLRQPIHAQSLFLQTLSNTALTDFQKKILQKANNAAQVTSEMLATLLDFSKLEAGVVTPHVTNFYLQPVLHQIENELGVQADAKSLVYRSREATVAVSSDASMLALILRNLVSNAIRYTSHGGVLVASRRRGRHVLIEVWDTGIGIPASKYDEIFLEFHQLGNSERNREKGLGLGLAIAKGYAKALGHELTLNSRLGGGSVFRLKVPIAFVVDTSPVLRHEVGLGRLNFDVLLIEDDALVADAMQTLLHSWGCVVRVATNLSEALMRVNAHFPQLVISDYRLSGGLTSADVIENIRLVFNQPALPAIIVTGDTAPERIREAMSRGIPLLHKPIQIRQLHQAMLDACATQ